MELEGSYRLFFELATSDWCVKLIFLGGRTHEARFGFVWRGSGDAYRDYICDALSRDAFRRRCWQLKVL